MIKRNTRLNRLREPFLLKPAYKDYLWGGTRLNDEFSKRIQSDAVAETWECSTHPDGVSEISSGFFEGKRLDTVISDYPSLLGKKWEKTKELPILVKLIDAKQDLSIQVHPDDQYAKVNEKGQNGKIELWYVLDAQKDSKIVYGLNQSLSKDQLLDTIKSGRLEYYLQRINARADDVFLIEPGLIHAIGAGTLVAEIQESSNLTYRLFDFDRTDRSGYKRELHLEKALDVANLNASTEPVQPMRVLNYKPGCATELLSRCKYFQVERLLVNTERTRDLVCFQTDELSFKVLLCVKGCCSLSFSNKSINVFKGDCVFVPANSFEIKIHGSAQFLSISC